MSQEPEESRQKYLDMLAEGVQTDHPDEMLNWVKMALDFGVPLEKIHVWQDEEDSGGKAGELKVRKPDDETLSVLMTRSNAVTHQGLPILGDDLFTQGSAPGSGETTFVQVEKANNFLMKMIKIDA